MIHGARHHEQQIGQSIEVDDQDRLDRAGPERDHAPLGATADGARQVQQRARRRSARQNEPAQRRQLCLETIDRLLEPLDVGVGDRRLRDALRDARRRIGEARPEREQILLHRLDERRHVGVHASRPRGAQAGVHLVHLAVRIDPRVGLGDPRVVEQRRLAGIAGLCVDLHRVEL